MAFFEENATKALDRYSPGDEYVIEELRCEYQASDSKGRIRLLKRLQKNVLPYELCLLVVEDSRVEVRRWFARHGSDFDYRDGNLKDRLQNDPDPMVRACLCENPSVPGIFTLDWKERFQEATHLERLALVRNPKVHEDLIEQIFDPEDKELGLDLKTRGELALAYLTNTKALAKKRKDIVDSDDGWAWYRAGEHFSKLWELASKWPPKTAVPWAAYRHVDVEDKKKAEVYKNCKDSYLRGTILEGANSRNTKTLKLGLKDENEICRYEAYGIVGHLDAEEVEALLKSEDKMALSALARNRSMTREVLTKVGDRLSELDDDSSFDASRTIREIEESRAPKDPEELFGWLGQQDDSLSAKVDFIGQHLLKMEKKLDVYALAVAIIILASVFWYLR